MRVKQMTCLRLVPEPAEIGGGSAGGAAARKGLSAVFGGAVLQSSAQVCMYQKSPIILIKSPILPPKRDLLTRLRRSDFGDGGEELQGCDGRGCVLL